MRALWALSLATLVAGCGGAAPGSPIPPKAGAGEDSEIERTDDVVELERRLAENERALEQELGGPVVADQREPEAESPKQTETSSRPDDDQPASTQPPGRCAVACRALGSMRRSADRICTLTAADDSRCTNARQRVTRASQRVERAGCACSE
jgi:hypothetical protein